MADILKKQTGGTLLIFRQSSATLYSFSGFSQGKQVK